MAAPQVIEEAARGKEIVVETDLVKAVVRTGVSVMPFFRKTEVSDADLNALAAYLAEPKNK